MTAAAPQALAQGFAAQFLAPNAARWAQGSFEPEALFQAAGSAGLLGLQIPLEQGGLNWTFTETAQVLHTLKQRDPETPTAIVPTAAQLDDCGWVANRWCELLPVPLELKQRLMELDNPLVRLELVGDVLERTGIAPTQ